MKKELAEISEEGSIFYRNRRLQITGAFVVA